MLVIDETIVQSVFAGINITLENCIMLIVGIISIPVVFYMVGEIFAIFRKVFNK